MLINRRRIYIQWGDCDPAGIVFYPRYLEYFDACTTALFERAGLPAQAIRETYGIVGVLLVSLQVRFVAPSRFGDEVMIESSVRSWRRSSFEVQHRLFKGDALAVEALETRVWTARSDTEPARLRGQQVPPEVIRKFSSSAEEPHAVRADKTADARKT